MKQHIQQLIKAALQQLKQSQQITCDFPAIHIDATKDKQYGDFACNIALMLAKAAGRKPRELAEKIVEALPVSTHVIKVEIAGPGFINFFLAPHAFYSVIGEVLAAGINYGRTNIGQGKRVLVEFVSSNPTGPLHVGHGRHGAFGSVVSDLLDAVGFVAHREYYVNDAGRQMDILTVSTWLRYLILCGENVPFPANGYQGAYVTEIARALYQTQETALSIPAKTVLADLPADEPEGGDKEIYIDAVIAKAKTCLTENQYETIFALTLKTVLDDIRDDLTEFGVHFDEWFSEREFIKTGVVDRMINTLQEKGLVYEREGALWFRSTDFNDDKDRVLQRANGVRTYFANDLAYHMHKFERGFESAIDIFGSDHHGYIPRMRAGLHAFGIHQDKLKYLLLQFVSLYRSGEQVQMSTRSGSFITLRELRAEVGNDVTRFFYVMRKAEQPVDFDLDLAKSQSNENPVYYIQYAHARVCSVFRQLVEKNMTHRDEDGLKSVTLLTQSHELQLLATLSRYKDIIVNAAMQQEPHLLTHYLRDLANDFHGYYNSHQFIVEDSALRDARLTLILAVRQVIANGLTLLGVSTPESM